MSDSPARRRRRKINHRVALFESRLAARCFAYEVDADAGELEIVHPNPSPGAPRVVAVVDLMALGVDVLDDTYRMGVTHVVDLVRRTLVKPCAH